jgi:glycosyltransferase involved in cell wall biosynthesis
MVAQPAVAGVSRHVVDLAAALSDRGLEVTVAAPRGSQTWADLGGRPGIRLVPFTAHRAPHASDLVWLLRMLPAVRAADVVHAHSSKAGFLVRLAAVLTASRSRCVYTPHGWSFWSAGGAKGRLYLALERLAAHWCARVLAVSRYERDAALELHVGRERQYVVVTNGTDIARFAAPPVPVPGAVVVVARLAPPKRVDLVVRAVAVLRAAGIEATLRVVGGGPLHAETAAVVTSVGADGYVELLGDRDDVPALLAAASCFVLASDYEGCPLSVLEAMAAGLPVVVTRVGGIDEIVDEEVGHVVDPTPEAIAAAVGALLVDPAYAGRLGASARARAAERHSVDRVASAVHDVYLGL